MPLINGVYTPLTFDASLSSVIAAAPASIQFAPGNPPELVLANMFAEADVLLDENVGEILAALVSPVGAMIDLLNPNNPRGAAVAASGYVLVSNSTTSPIAIPPNTLLTASTGQEYSIGVTTPIIPALGSAEVFITASSTGAGGNIASGQTFTVAGLSHLTGINTLPILNGADVESDALYLNRVTAERTEYGAQSGSVATEKDIKSYYADARMYVNQGSIALTTPVPVPAQGYNLIVLTPYGALSTAADVSQIFSILSNRLEFVNAQNIGTTKHVVMSGTVYDSEIPQNYYFTVAQPTNTTMTVSINVRASSKADHSELTVQANAFASAFLQLLMAFFGGISGNTNVTYHDGVVPDVVTAVPVAGLPAGSGAIAPAFGIGTILSMVGDVDSAAQSPQLVYDATPSLSMTIDPQVPYEAPLTLSIGGTTFVNFKADPLFSDGTSWFDRYMYINPANISITVSVSAWI